MIEYENDSEITLSFYKVSSDNKILKNEEYELQSVDGKSSGVTFFKEENGRFNLNDEVHEISNDHVDDLIPDFILDKIKSVETLDDIQTLFGSDDFYSVDSYYYEAVTFYLPVVIKQTAAEPGYAKNDILTSVFVDVAYYHSQDEITRVNIKINSAMLEQYIYGDLPEIKSIEDIKAIQYNDFEDDEFACMNSNAGLIITSYNECTIGEPWGSDNYYMVPYFVESKGTVELSIENTVNGVAKYNASKDNHLEYKITVKNTGNVSSSGNVIVTYVPGDVTVKEDSISDSGVYSKDNKTITWNVDLIDSMETVEFSYEAEAPSSMDGKELTGKSSVQSEQVLAAVYSNETIVTMDKIIEIIKNPDTGTMVYIAHTNIGMTMTHVLMFLIILFVVIMFSAYKIRQLKRHN